MVDEINTQHTWRQITSPGRVKKVKQRPDFNRDKQPGNQKGGHKKKKSSDQSSHTDTASGRDLNGSRKKATKDRGDDSADKKKDRTGRARGKLIDIVV